MTQYVTGVKELERKLKNIDEKLSQKYLAQSLRAAMVPLRNKAISNAPKGSESHKTNKRRVVAPGFLKSNIKLKKMRVKDKRFAGYTLAARGEAWYGKLIETGWRAGKRSKGVKAASRRVLGGLSQGNLSGLGDNRRYVKGRPWLGKAWESEKANIQANLIKNLKKRIEKAKK